MTRKSDGEDMAEWRRFIKNIRDAHDRLLFASAYASAHRRDAKESLRRAIAILYASFTPE